MSFAFAFPFASIERALAQGQAGDAGSVPKLTNPLCGGNPNCTLADIADKIITFLFDVSLPIVSIMVLIGGFQMLTAGGNAEKFGAGKKTVAYAAIGFAVISVARGITSIIKSITG